MRICDISNINTARSTSSDEFVGMIEPALDDVRVLVLSMEDGSYEFADGGLAFIEMLDRYRDA
ncbi:MAG: hypothetical protein HKO86_05445 [Gammaproteobacteria bacterium]|nr:hypothetical protein [Gammaproteobacteria bacterium]